MRTQELPQCHGWEHLAVSTFEHVSAHVSRNLRLSHIHFSAGKWNDMISTECPFPAKNNALEPAGIWTTTAVNQSSMLWNVAGWPRPVFPDRKLNWIQAGLLHQDIIESGCGTCGMILAQSAPAVLIKKKTTWKCKRRFLSTCNLNDELFWVIFYMWYIMPVFSIVFIFSWSCCDKLNWKTAYLALCFQSPAHTSCWTWGFLVPSQCKGKGPRQRHTHTLLWTCSITWCALCDITKGTVHWHHFFGRLKRKICHGWNFLC